MKPADRILITGLLLLSLVLLIPLFFSSQSGAQAVVSVQRKEVLRLDLGVDADYVVQGTLGPVHIQIREGKVAVTQENSPQHLCSRQGFSNNPALPIVCLPNETVVVIESASSNGQEDTVIQ